MRWKAKKHHTRLHIIKKNFLRLSVKISHKKRVLKRKAKIEIKVPWIFSLEKHRDISS